MQVVESAADRRQFLLLTVESGRRFVLKHESAYRILPNRSEPVN